jgi:hypothetical protein
MAQSSSGKFDRLSESDLEALKNFEKPGWERAADPIT